MKAILFAAALLGVSSVAAGANFTPAATRACLKAHGAVVFPGRLAPIAYHDPEIIGQLWWVLQKKPDPLGGGGYTPDADGVNIMFTRTSASAARLESRFARHGRSFGFTKSEIFGVLGRSSNVVWLKSNSGRPKPLTAKQHALLRRCLR